MEMLNAATLAVLLTSLVARVAHGHLCMLSPPQRGSMTGLNKPGSPDCILLTSPCGGRNSGPPVLELAAGQNFTFTLQKNLDHFNKATPGSFIVSIGMKEDSLTKLVSFPDTAAPSLTLYSFNVTMPKMHGEMVVQAQYQTNNPQAPPVFHQCADIRLVKK